MNAGINLNPVFRRTFAVSLALGALSLAACGGTHDKAGPSCDRPEATFEQASTPLTFRAAGASPSALDETVRILCARLAASGTEHRVRRAAGDRIVVELPVASPLARQTLSAFDTRVSSSVFRDGTLAVYDWEANVVGPDGTPAPGDRRVGGGPGAGQLGSLSLYDAVLRAARRQAVVEADNAVAGSRFYAVDPKTRRMLSAVPAASKAQALTALAPGSRADAKVYEVKPDTVIVRAEQPPGAIGGDEWFVLEDDAALRGDMIVRPRAHADPAAGPPGAPAVTFGFTPEGRRHWTRLSEDIVQRGRRNVRSSEPVELSFQHFAIVLDDRILAVPFLDFRVHPEGVSPDAGTQIPGGLTIASARQLAAVLASGELPQSLEAVGSG